MSLFGLVSFMVFSLFFFIIFCSLLLYPLTVFLLFHEKLYFLFDSILKYCNLIIVNNVDNDIEHLQWEIIYICSSGSNIHLI